MSENTMVGKLVVAKVYGSLGEPAEVIRETEKRYYVKPVLNSRYIIGISGRGDNLYLNKDDAFVAGITLEQYRALKTIDEDYTAAVRDARRVFNEVIDRLKTERAQRENAVLGREG